MREVVISAEELADLSEAVLTKGGSMRFKARGSSMLPFLRDGDTIVVRPVNQSALERGSVGLCRCDSNKLVAHRVVGFHGTDQGSTPTLLVRGDIDFGQGELVSWDEVLGNVVSVERGRRVLHLDRGFRRMAGRIMARCGWARWCVVVPPKFLRRVAAVMLRLLRNFGPSRKPAR
jgi:hypothetical protein